MQDKGRFLFVDGLRGVAALMVVGYHFFGNLPESSQAATPTWLTWLFHNGNLGVDIFFVLSGFVIAHSVRNGAFSVGYVARFALRRSVRLDPPLWVTIALELLLIRVSLFFFPGLGTPIPGWKEIAANATYTQRFLGISDVLPVFWSLTYEVQFYIVLVITLLLLRLRRGGAGKRAPGFLFLVVFAYSLLMWVGVLPVPLRGIFLDRWFQFALGAAAWATVRGHCRPRWFAALALGSLGIAFGLAPTSFRMLAVCMAVLTAGALAYAGLCGKMSWLSGAIPQFFGRTSYSLYLLHLPIGWRLMSLCRELLGSSIGPLLGYVILITAVAISVLASWIMFALLERPSVALARRIKLPTVEGPVPHTA